MLLNLRVPLSVPLRHKLICDFARAFSAECQEKKEVPPDCSLASRVAKPRVIIIGAGMAGLSAAERLLSCGINNIQILEATERPGGRIYSCWMDNVITELGCDNITGGSNNNSVYNLAVQEGLKMIRKHSNPLLLSNEGRAIDNHIVEAVFRKYLPLQAKITKLFKKDCAEANGSLKDFLALRIEQEIKKFPEEQQIDATKVFYALLNCLQIYIGDDLCNVSADSIGSNTIPPGGNMVLPTGLIHVVTPLLQNIPEKLIIYNKPVGNITWGEEVKEKNARVCVQCCDGQVYQADYIIITFSLGVLKEYGDKFFCPSLPCSKLEAIKKLGFGKINKIFLKFNKPFWTQGRGDFNLAWSPFEKKDINTWIRGVNCIREVPLSKNILSVRVAGEEACYVEGAPEEEVVESVTKVLRQFTGDPTIPYANSVLVSKWSSNPFFCGANSYMKMNSHVGHQCDLAAPVPDMFDATPPILLFAGEATIPGHYGSLHGARLSGIREADRIIELTKKMNGPPPKLQVNKCRVSQ